MRTNRDCLLGSLRQLAGGCLHPGGLSLTRRALEAAAFAPGARLLDLGCGGGASLGLLLSLGFAAVGLDRCPAEARAALAGACGAAAAPDAPDLSGLPGPAVVLADMAALPFADAVFDGILCECVLSLAADKAKVLGGCARLLRPGGRMILSDLTLADTGAARTAMSAAVATRATLTAAKTTATGPATATGAGAVEFSPDLCARGAVSVGEWRALLEAAGLTLVLLEDHSRALRELAAKLVWQGQSLVALSGLWHNAGIAAEAACRRAVPSEDKTAAVCSAPPSEDTPAPASGAAPRLGYFLLIAEKREKDHEGPRC